MKIHLSILTLLIAITVFSQPAQLDSVIQKNRYVVQISNGRLAGPGASFLQKATQDCQFVALGESHNKHDIPIFTTALFSLLQEGNGFQYLALEQDPLRSLSVSRPRYKGRKDSAVSLAKQFPFSYTMTSDQEIEMIANVSRLSKGNGRPIWGCDQAFAVTHYLKELLPYAPSKEARAFTKKLMDSAWSYENNRNNDKHFLAEVCKAEDIAGLAELYKQVKQHHPQWLIHSLEVSQRIYGSYNKGMEGIPGGYYMNGYEREEYMKERLIEEYMYALKRDKKIPKAVLKFGHWHVMNGLGPSNLSTTGSFVRALAKFNGLNSFYISMNMFEKPGALTTDSTSVLSFFSKYCKDNEWTLFDLRPLRSFVDIIRTKLPPALAREYERFVFINDAILVFGNKTQATYHWKPS